MLAEWVGRWMKGQMDKGHLRAIPLVLEVPVDFLFLLRIVKVVLIGKGV